MLNLYSLQGFRGSLYHPVHLCLDSLFYRWTDTSVAEIGHLVNYSAPCCPLPTWWVPPWSWRINQIRTTMREHHWSSQCWASLSNWKRLGTDKLTQHQQIMNQADPWQRIAFMISFMFWGIRPGWQASTAFTPHTGFPKNASNVEQN